MKLVLQTFLILVFFLFLSCERGEDPQNVNYISPFEEWLVPVDEVFDAGVGKDGIPSIDEPQFSPPEEVNPVFDEVLVMGIEHEGELKAYPVPMLNWHEIVNDEVNGLEVAITYCPLTGTGIGWSRRVSGVLTSWGVSGLLYNTNLMPYDRLTNSTWSQQRLECVNGPQRGRNPKTYTLIETTFKTWKKSFPNSKVLNANTGFDRRYSEYPYLDYRTNHDLLFFPVSPKDDRIPAKERVLGVIVGEDAKAYRFNLEETGMDVIQDQVGAQEVIILQSTIDNINAAFLPKEGRQYTAIQEGFPAVMKDDQENIFDLAGRVIQGPDQGTKLERPVSFVGFWFSWGAFYPGIEIYEP